jgi:hypothetical protein
LALAVPVAGRGGRAFIQAGGRAAGLLLLLLLRIRGMLRCAAGCAKDRTGYLVCFFGVGVMHTSGEQRVIYSKTSPSSLQNFDSDSRTSS